VLACDVRQIALGTVRRQVRPRNSSTARSGSASQTISPLSIMVIRRQNSGSVPSSTVGLTVFESLDAAWLFLEMWRISG
jgi:hypothetical protein